LLVPEAAAPLPGLLEEARAASSGAPASVAVLIGPEGGLAEEEIELACRHGFRPCSLGPRTLRTETAPLAALAAIQTLAGDFRAAIGLR
jgi:RsmE family RNA methyltransferase